MHGVEVGVKLDHGEFQNQLNSRFSLQLSDSESVELLLTEVSELSTSPRQEMFAIVFRGPANSIMPQRIYHLANDTIGELDLFLVPIKQDDEGVYYEAVFNRMLKNNG